MFSFFNKKRPQDDSPAPAAEAPPFDYNAPVPEGWGLLLTGNLFEWERATPIESFGQVRQVVESRTIEDGSFSIINTVKMPPDEKAIFKARFDGSLPWRAHATPRAPGQWKIAIDDNQKRMLQFGEPGLGTKSHPLVSTENATLILCSFLRGDGTLPDLPHLLTSRPKPDDTLSGPLYF